MDFASYPTERGFPWTASILESGQLAFQPETRKFRITTTKQAYDNPMIEPDFFLLKLGPLMLNSFRFEWVGMKRK